MTWEWVVLTSVVAICFAALRIFNHPLKVDPAKIEKDFRRMGNSLDDVCDRVLKVEAEWDSIHKLAEETKKLLSQQNLAAGLRR